MGKLILMSVVLMTGVIAAIAARDPLPRRGLGRAMLGLVIFNLIYAALISWVYPMTMKSTWTGVQSPPRH